MSSLGSFNSIDTTQPPQPLHVRVDQAHRAPTDIANRLLNCLQNQPTELHSDTILNTLLESADTRQGFTLTKNLGEQDWRFVQINCDPTTLSAHQIANSCKDIQDGIVLRKVLGQETDQTLIIGVANGNQSSHLFGLVYSDATKSRIGIDVAKQAMPVLSLAAKSNEGSQTNTQLESLAAILELTDTIHHCDDQDAATVQTVNQMVAYLNCHSVAIGIQVKGSMTLKSISGSGDVQRTSPVGRAYEQALAESFDRKSPATYPALEEENDHQLVAHRELAQELRNVAIASCPLTTESGDRIGAWVFSGDHEKIQSDSFANFLAAASPRVASALQRINSSRTPKWLRNTGKAIPASMRWKVAIAAIIFILVMMIPVKYKVSCDCATVPSNRRFAVAPFDGLILQGFVEPGDRVSQNQPLAEVDGRTIRWELMGVHAKRQKTARQRDIELAEQNIPEMILADLENQKLLSDEKILEYQRDNLMIRSPIDGVVLSGSLERAEAASVETGQVLFEIAPLDRMKVEIEIPADDIGHVVIGSQVRVRLQGSNELIEGQVSRLHPRSEIRNATNVFVAEVEFENELNLMPGMKGNAKIVCETKSLGWCLFHKPVNQLRSFFAFW